MTVTFGRPERFCDDRIVEVRVDGIPAGMLKRPDDGEWYLLSDASEYPNIAGAVLRLAGLHDNDFGATQRDAKREIRRLVQSHPQPPTRLVNDRDTYQWLANLYGLSLAEAATPHCFT